MRLSHFFSSLFAHQQHDARYTISLGQFKGSLGNARFYSDYDTGRAAMSDDMFLVIDDHETRERKVIVEAPTDWNDVNGFKLHRYVQDRYDGDAQKFNRMITRKCGDCDTTAEAISQLKGWARDACHTGALYVESNPAIYGHYGDEVRLKDGTLSRAQKETPVAHIAPSRPKEPSPTR